MKKYISLLLYLLLLTTTCISCSSSKPPEEQSSEINTGTDNSPKEPVQGTQGGTNPPPESTEEGPKKKPPTPDQLKPDGVPKSSPSGTPDPGSPPPPPLRKYGPLSSLVDLSSAPNLDKPLKASHELKNISADVKKHSFSDASKDQDKIIKAFEDLHPEDAIRVLEDMKDGDLDTCYRYVVRLWELKNNKLDQFLDFFWQTHVFELNKSKTKKDNSWISGKLDKKDSCEFDYDFIASRPLYKVSFKNKKGLGGQDDFKKLAHSKTITELDFEDSDITDGALSELASLVTLTKLNLKNTLIGDEGLLSLKPLVNLRELNIESKKPTTDRVGITDKGMAVLPSLQKLEKVNFRKHIKITDAAASYFSSLQHLVEADLGFTKIGDDVTTVLSKCPKLKKLNLRSSRVRLPGIRELVNARELRALDLSNTIGTILIAGIEMPQISPDQFVTEVLKLNQVTHLSLSSNLLDEASGAILGKASHLFDLDISHNPAMAGVLSKPRNLAIDAFAENLVLKYLKMIGNKFSGRHLIVFKDAKLKELTMKKSHIPQETKTCLQSNSEMNLNLVD